MAQVQASYASVKNFIALLMSVDPKQEKNLFLLNTNEVGIGHDPLKPAHIIDIASETIRAVNGATAPQPTSPRPEPATFKSTRKSGKYYIDVLGRTIECGSLPEVLAEGLKAVETHKTGTLDKLTHVMPRSKRIVAKNPADLFVNTPELVEKHSEKLMGDWYFGTNNSSEEVKRWLQRACKLAGIKWDKELSVSF